LHSAGVIALMRAMPSSRNLLLGGGAVALALLAFSLGRRVEADKAGPTNPSSMPVSSAPPSDAALPAADASPAATPLSDPGALKDLFMRLQAERAHRPNLEPTSNSVFDLVKAKGGVEVEEQLQVAGWVVGAKFCDKIRSTKDVHIVVCEYVDEAEAIKGQKAATNAIPRREVLRNKTTTCAVHQAGESAAAAAQAARVKELFKAM
jgi:hypothetical protein